MDILDALPVAVYATDAEGRITYYNEAAAALWGHRPKLGTDKWCGSWKLWWPSGERLAHEDCPMAVMLREGRAMAGVEAVAERPDGSRVPFAPYPRLLKDADGKVIGAVNALVEIGDRQAAHVNAERLAAIVASSDDAIIGKDLDSNVISWNRGAERIFGYTAEEMIGQSILRIIPERLQHEEPEIIRRLKQGERIDHFDTVRVAKDGREIELSITVSPIRDLSGRIVGASKVARDITQRKRDEAFQYLLVQELNHRVKNSLAIVQSIATQSLRRAPSPEHFTESFSGRVRALAKAHDLLVRQRIGGTSLREMIKEQVQLGSANDERINVVGPEVVVAGRDAINLALVLHELATNARKYGALSADQPAGSLTIQWRVDYRPLPKLELKWEETGVAGMRTPDAKGFGSILIERSLQGSGGEASLSVTSDGFKCGISLPLEGDQDALPMQERNSTRADNGRILIVEDEPLIALELEQALIATGFSVVGPVGTVGGALKLIETEQVDAALLDANLAGHPVDEVAAALTRANIPFAFATGHDREGLPQSFASAPILRKPFNSAEVVAMVSDIMRRPDAQPLRALVSVS
jgi:PAS domain S-box-containing protein